MSRIMPSERVPVGPADRGYISPKLKAQVMLASDGRCALCRVKLGVGEAEIDHRLPVWMGGLTKVGNLRALCVACHSGKTKSDAANRAKTKRLQAKNLPQTELSDKPSKRRNAIQSKGFDKSRTRHFDGSVTPR